MDDNTIEMHPDWTPECDYLERELNFDTDWISDAAWVRCLACAGEGQTVTAGVTGAIVRECVLCNGEGGFHS